MTTGFIRSEMYVKVCMCVHVAKKRMYIYFSFKLQITHFTHSHSCDLDWNSLDRSELFVFLPLEFLIENSINECHTRAIVQLTNPIGASNVRFVFHLDCSVYHMAKWLAKWFAVKILFYWIYFSNEMALEIDRKKNAMARDKEKVERGRGGEKRERERSIENSVETHSV